MIFIERSTFGKFPIITKSNCDKKFHIETPITPTNFIQSACGAHYNSPIRAL